MAKLSLPKNPKVFKMRIGGKEDMGGATEYITRKSPAHGVPVGKWPAGDAKCVDKAVKAARKAFDSGVWSRIHVSQRSAVLRKTAELVEKNKEALAYQETLETGKPISASRGELEAIINLWHYAAGACRTIRGESYNNLGENLFAVTIRQPIGVVGGIIPWNFPLLILSERLPFILAAGCTAVIKPSEQTCGTSLMIADLLKKAGLPDGVANIVTGYGRKVGQRMLEHKDIDMISFTGSTEVGRLTLEAAASNIKKLGLELGGKNPFILFEDADVKAAADAAALAMTYNAGQCCVASSRLIAHKSVVGPFKKELVKRIKRIKVGDPLDESTHIGAISEKVHFEKIMGYLKCGEGKILVGGKSTGPKKGMFIEPTLLENVKTSDSIYKEEIFGPVMTINTFSTYDQAVKMANDTEYGLSAFVWSSNVNTCLKAIRDVTAGRIWVNTALEDGPETPLGGCKQSGLGREVSVMGIEEYTEIKTANINLAKRNMWLGD